MVWEGAEIKTDIIVHDQIKSMIDEHGREGYLRKRTGQQCRCIDPVTREANPDCPTCAGMGYAYVDKKILYYRRSGTRPLTGARAELTDVGVLLVDETAIYIAVFNGLFPVIKDWIVEVITDSNGKVVQPPLIERVYDVEDVLDPREIHSQVSYITLRVKLVPTGK